MKTKLYLLALLLALVPGAWAADVNITNITPAATIPAGSYALGTTGQITRLLSVELLRAPGSNYTQQVGQNNTNYTLIVGGNGTNYALQLGLSSSNYTVLVGGEGSNNVMVLSNVLATLAMSETNAYKVRELIASTGITLTTNTTTGAITISSTGGGIAVEVGTNGIALATNGSVVTIHFKGDDVTIGNLNATTLTFTNRAGADSNQVAVLDANTNLVHSTTLYQPTNAGSAGKILTATSGTTTAFSDPAAASTVAAGATINAADGNALTNLAYIVKTNHTGNGTIAQGVTTITNVTGNVTLGGFSGLVNGHENFAAVLVIPDGSTRTITMAAGVASTDGATAYYATNAQRLKLQFSIIPGVWTNVAAIHSR